MKSDVFEKELDEIKNIRIRNTAEFMLNRAPQYFYEVPASSTGKFHPFVDQGHGGLVRHTKLAVAAAIDSFRLEEFNFNDIEKDLVLLSVLMHDIKKCGDKPSSDELTGTKTHFEHPRLAAKFVKACNLLLYLTLGEEFLTDKELDFVYGCVESHMGQWNKKEGYEDLPRPKTPAQKCVHNADYIASRRYFDNSYLSHLQEKGYDIKIDPETNALLENDYVKESIVTDLVTDLEIDTTLEK